MATLSLFPDRTSGRTADGFCSTIFICRSFAFHLLSVTLLVMSWAAVASLPWWPFCFVGLSYPWGCLLLTHILLVALMCISR